MPMAPLSLATDAWLLKPGQNKSLTDRWMDVWLAGIAGWWAEEGQLVACCWSCWNGWDGDGWSCVSDW